MAASTEFAEQVFRLLTEIVFVVTALCPRAFYADRQMAAPT